VYVDINDLNGRFDHQSDALSPEASCFYCDILTDKGLEGTVTTVLVRAAVANPYGPVNCYGKDIPDGAVIGVLNGTIGASGNRVTGVMSFRDARRMSDAYQKEGYLVPRAEFTGKTEEDARRLVALVNIELNGDWLEKAIRYP